MPCLLLLVRLPSSPLFFLPQHPPLLHRFSPSSYPLPSLPSMIPVLHLTSCLPHFAGTAARSWIALGTVLRWAIIIFPFAYIAFVGSLPAYLLASSSTVRYSVLTQVMRLPGTILACVGTYSLEVISAICFRLLCAKSGPDFGFGAIRKEWSSGWPLTAGSCIR